MKIVVSIYVLLVIASCKTPGAITANPADETSTSGTIGSARMTKELPPKPNNVVVKPDTSKIRMDSIEAKRPKQ